MKIAILNALYAPYQVGGAEKSVALLAEALAARGHYVSVITLCEGIRPEPATDMGGVRVFRLPLDNLYWPYGTSEARVRAWKKLLWHWGNRWNRRAAARVGALLDKLRPDVIHCNVVTGFSASVWEEAARRKIPIVQTLRDYGLLCARSALFRNGQTCQSQCLDCKVLTRPARTHSALPARVVSNSAYVVGRHTDLGYFPGIPTEVIFNIADQIDPKAMASAGRTNDPFTFGYIGRVEPEKGIEMVLQATKQLRLGDWRLKIAGRGDPDYVSGLKRQYPDERIEWLGFMTPAEFYIKVDTVLISSVWPEPLPRTLIESFAYGRSAICSTAGGIPEIAALGRCVASYTPTDVGGLAAAMKEAMGNPKRWRAGGFLDESVMRFFAPDRITSLYEKAYENAIASRAV